MSFALTRSEIRALAEAGAAAPSGGNAQAWRVVASADALSIALDIERSQSFIDVGRLASIVGVGSFTENVAIAAEALGLEHEVTLLEPDEESAPLVRFSFTGRREPGAPPPLHAAISTRATNRKPWDGTPIDAADVDAIRASVQAVGGDAEGDEPPSYDLCAVSAEDDKRAVAKVLGEADVVRTFNRAFHEQMLSEMRWTEDEAKQTLDGIDVGTLELPPGDLSGLKMMRHRLFVSVFVTKNRVRAMAEAGLTRSSHLCSVVMPEAARPAQLLDAGRALQRAWLTATTRGLSVQPWCVLPMFVLRAEREPDTLPPAEVAKILDIGRRFDALMGISKGRRAIFTFRLSRADPPSVLALRRPWDAFTEITGV